MRGFKTSRLLALIACLAFAAFVVSGCGDDNDGSKTGAGAPAGATGNEAGGAAVEAGKQRDPKEVAQEKKEFSEEPPPVQLQTGDRSGYIVSEPTVRIIRSQKELDKVTKRLYSRGVNAEIVAPVDFRTRQAILVQFPKQPKGTLMQVQDVHVLNGKILVRAARILPGKKCPKAKYKPNPYNLVETRIMQGTPTLKIENVTTSPC